MGEAQSQFQVCSLHLCIVADALDFQFLGESFGYAENHVVQQCTVQTVQGAVFDFIIRTGNDDFVAFHFEIDFFIQFTG